LLQYCSQSISAATPVVLLPTIDRAVMPTIYKLDKRWPELYVRPAITIRQPIDELYAQPLSLPPLVPYYYPNRPSATTPAVDLIRQLLLLPAAYPNSTSAAPPAANHLLLPCLQYYDRPLLPRLQHPTDFDCSACSLQPTTTAPPVVTTI